MKIKGYVRFITLFMLLGLGLSKILFLESCANIIPPSGGPRDSLPPVLLKADPPDSTLNFRGDRITLTFNEYVTLQDVQNNLMFTPTFNVNPQIDARLRTLTIRLRDTLEPNTTYVFNFGNAVVDNNEGNAIRGFDYTFSTGPQLDSLEFSGRVLLAETGQVDSTLTVILHRNLADSAVVKERPRYVTRVDRNGTFTFKNLPPGSFAVYALGEAGLLRRYQSNQFFAFANAPVLISDSVAPLTLYAYKETPRPVQSNLPAATPKGTKGNTENRIRFSTNYGTGDQDLLKDLIISFEQPLRTFDASKISLTRDSIFNSVSYTTSLDSTKKLLTIKTTWTEGSRYNLILDRDFADDSSGNKLLKSDTLFFKSRKKSEYGAVSIRFRNIDTVQNPVLQIVQNGIVVYSSPVNGNTFTSSLFLPGEYELRMLHDSNNNGVWDPGQFFRNKRQPERVTPIERRITIRPAWTNEFEINL